MEKIREKNQISDEKSDKENEKTEKLAHVFDDGVEFRDPYSSRIIKFTPEMSIAAQHKIGADVMMSFDELTNVEDSYNYNVAALERTRKWAERGLREHIRQTNLRVGKKYQALYGCLQGASFRDLREKAARDLAEMSVDGWKFDGFGLGGAFLKENLGEIVSWMTQILPEEKPRHLLGLARPDDIFAGVENGADTFDCVAPTREARHGRIYTLRGNINLRRAEFSADNSPLDENCDCPTCVKNIREILADFYKNSSDNLADFSANSEKFENNSDDFFANSENNSKNNSDDFLHDFQAKFDTNFDEKFSRKTLRKMLKNPDEKIRARVFTLLSQHNLRFIIRLMENIRAAIFRGNYAEFKRDFCAKYYK